MATVADIRIARDTHHFPFLLYIVYSLSPQPACLLISVAFPDGVIQTFIPEVCEHLVSMPSSSHCCCIFFFNFTIKIEEESIKRLPSGQADAKLFPLHLFLCSNCPASSILLIRMHFMAQRVMLLLATWSLHTMSQKFVGSSHTLCPVGHIFFLWESGPLNLWGLELQGQEEQIPQVDHKSNDKKAIPASSFVFGFMSSICQAYSTI